MSFKIDNEIIVASETGFTSYSFSNEIRKVPEGYVVVGVYGGCKAYIEKLGFIVMKR